MGNQQSVWEAIREELDAAGIVVLDHNEVQGEAADWLERHFRDQIFPVLTL